MEIEKKFKIKKFPLALEQYASKHIEQGYLCVNPVVRIRKSDDRYILTYKSKFGVDDTEASDVRINNEMEVLLNEEGYAHLREKIDGFLIEKTRYIIPLPDGHTGEFDVFEGALKGLYYIEVEFKDEQDAADFQPPQWFGENVSDDIRYSNSYISGLTEIPEFINGGFKAE